MRLDIPNIKSLIELGRIKERHPLYNLSKDECTFLDEALGIAYRKYRDSGKEVNELLGNLCDIKSYQGLLGELFWCHRLTQLGYSFKTESREGQKDLRIELDNRIVYAEVKTILEHIKNNQQVDIYARLRNSIQKQIDSNEVKCIIFITIRQNFSDESIKHIANKMKEVVERISLSQEKYTFYYPEDSVDTYKCQVEVSITPYTGENHVISIVLPAIMGTDDELLRKKIKKARHQLDKDSANVLFVDKTFYTALVENDMLNDLYGTLREKVYFDKTTGEQRSINAYRSNDGSFNDTSRISAVIVYERKGYHDLSGI